MIRHHLLSTIVALALGSTVHAENLVTLSQPSGQDLKKITAAGGRVLRAVTLPNQYREVMVSLPQTARAFAPQAAQPVRRLVPQMIPGVFQKRAAASSTAPSASSVGTRSLRTQGKPVDWTDVGLWGQIRIRSFGESIGRTASVPTSSGQRKIRVCVVDSGISETHSRLLRPNGQRVVTERFNFSWDPYLPAGQNKNPICGTDQSARCADDNFASPHGSMIAGLVAARDRYDGFVTEGVANGAVELYNAKVIGPHSDGQGGIEYNGYPIDVALGILWCAGYRLDNDPDIIDWYGFGPRTVPPADVINLSLGTSYDSDVLAHAVSYALDRGITLVASAGNSHDPALPDDSTNGPVSYPAAYPGVIAVGATDRFDAIAGFSSRGPEVTVVAPGVDIVASLTVEAGKEYFGMGQGTSLSAAFVTGTVALQLARTPWRWELSGADLGHRVTEQGTLGLVQVPSSVRH